MSSVSIVIPTAADVFPVLEFQTVLSVLRSRYLSAITYSRLGFGVDDDSYDEAFAFELAKELFWPDLMQETIIHGISRAEADIEEDDLLLSDIKRTNPIELIVIGLAAPLAAAVILSGGKLQMGSFLKAELPPIGLGIAKLRAALQPLSPKQIDQLQQGLLRERQTRPAKLPPLNMRS
jgi:hypothetical protein